MRSGDIIHLQLHLLGLGPKVQYTHNAWMEWFNNENNNSRAVGTIQLMGTTGTIRISHLGLIGYVCINRVVYTS